MPPQAQQIRAQLVVEVNLLLKEDVRYQRSSQQSGRVTDISCTDQELAEGALLRVRRWLLAANHRNHEQGESAGRCWQARDVDIESTNIMDPWRFRPS
jgi:hypothetical protein